MLELYFVRHGETEWNVENRLQGRLDSPLTERGIKEARLLAERLAQLPFKAAVSSPSTRAVETAKILIGMRGIPLYTDERLMEIDLGDWQGKTKAEIRAADPWNYECYYHYPHLYAREGSERFLDVKKRVEGLLADLERRFSSGNLLVVSHGMVIKVVQQLICKGLPVARLWDPPWIEGTSVTVVRAGGGKRELVVEGDISHLENNGTKK
ncbi:MAG: histidine phosphatase family protein [Bacillales bacterium]